MESITINAQSDNLPLATIISCPKKPVAIIQIVHGMCEHKERYLKFIEYLNQNQMGVIIHDLRGHGASILKEDDLGYFYKKSSDVLIADVYQLTCLIKQRYPDVPLFLFGHSMGSLIVRNYLYQYGHKIDGLIVCGSPSKNRFAKAGRLFCLCLSKVKGDRYRSKLIRQLSIGMFNRGFKEANSWICSDEQVVKQFNEDKLCNFNFTLNGYYNLLSLMITAYQKQNHQVNKQLPILFISGENDPCLINQKAFNQAVKHLYNLGYTNIKSRLFKQMRHEILNEKDKQIVYQEIINFINQNKE